MRRERWNERFPLLDWPSTLPTVFLLGPGYWRRPRSLWRRESPLDDRREIQIMLSWQGVDAILMEDEAETEAESRDPGAKFNRILDETGCQAIVVYWPAHAKMAATWAELTILAERRRRGEPVPPVHYVHELRAMDLDNGRLNIKEKGGRHLYLRGADQLTAMAWPWTSPRERQSAVAWCGAEIVGRDQPLAPPAIDLSRDER